MAPHLANTRVSKGGGAPNLEAFFCKVILAEVCKKGLIDKLELRRTSSLQRNWVYNSGALILNVFCHSCVETWKEND